MRENSKREKGKKEERESRDPLSSLILTIAKKNELGKPHKLTHKREGYKKRGIGGRKEGSAEKKRKRESQRSSFESLRKRGKFSL